MSLLDIFKKKKRIVKLNNPKISPSIHDKKDECYHLIMAGKINQAYKQIAEYDMNYTEWHKTIINKHKK